MAKKKKKNNIVAEVGFDGTLTKYNTKKTTSINKNTKNNIVAEVDLDGNISKYNIVKSTNNLDNNNKSFDFSVNEKLSKQSLVNEYKDLQKQLTNYDRKEK